MMAEPTENSRDRTSSWRLSSYATAVIALFLQVSAQSSSHNDHILSTGFESEVDIVLELENARHSSSDISGGLVEVAGNSGIVLILEFPESGFVVPEKQVHRVVPLSRSTTPPTGRHIVAGILWEPSPDNVVLLPELSILAPESERFDELAAFASQPDGSGFHFVPLVLDEQSGQVLVIPQVEPGITGITFASVESMQRFAINEVLASRMEVDSQLLSQGDVPAQEAQFIQELAIIIRQGFDYEKIKLVFQKWFDSLLEPTFSQVGGGCLAIEVYFPIWHKWEYFADGVGIDTDDISGIEQYTTAREELGNASDEYLAEINTACENTQNECQRIKLVEEGVMCAKMMDILGLGDFPGIPCLDAPGILNIFPDADISACPGDQTEFDGMLFRYNKLLNPEDPPIQDGPPIRWSSSDPKIVGIHPDTGVAQLLSEGEVVIRAEADFCGPPLRDGVITNSVVVRVEGVPDLKGAWTGFGSETISGCSSAGIEPGSGTATILTQGPGVPPVENTEEFSGTSQTSATGQSFNGKVQCGGAISNGLGEYTETEPCPEGTCIVTGKTEFKGSLHKNTMKINFTSTDLTGDTCVATGWATIQRQE